MNVFSLFENAVAAWGDRTAVRCGARRQTYRELDAAAAAFAGHLASLGLAPGDRVAVFMQNSLLYPAVLMGAFRGGYVAVPINAKLHPREVGYIVENAAAKAIVEEFKTRNIDPEGYTLYTYAAMQVWSQAVAKAGSTDAKKVMDKIKASAWETVIGNLSFDAKGDIKQDSYVVWKWDAKGNAVEINPKGS